MLNLGDSIWGILATLGTGLAIVVVRHLLGTRGARNVLRCDIELLAKLPSGMGRNALAASVQEQASQLAARTRSTRRDPAGTVLGIGFLGTALWMLHLALGGAWLWYIPMTFFALFGLYGTMEGMTPKVRDERGRAIDISEQDSNAGKPKNRSI